MQTHNKEKVKRGEIYLHDFGSNAGSIQNGVRPVLVVQCDEDNKASTTTIVAALTVARRIKSKSRLQSQAADAYFYMRFRSACEMICSTVKDLSICETAFIASLR